MTRGRVHHIIYVFLLFAMAAAIPVSNFVMSACGIFLAVNWLLEGNWSDKWQRFRKNRLAFFLVSFFFVILLGLIHTDNWRDGANNVLSKLPLLYAPLIFATSGPLTGREQRIVIGGFIGSTFVATIIALSQIRTVSMHDFRQMSQFISHIRFGFSVLLSIVFLVSFFVNAKGKRTWMNAIVLPLICCFVFYLFVSQTVTALFLLLVCTIVMVVYSLVVHQQLPCRQWILGGLVVLLVVFFGYLSFVSYQYFHYDRNTPLAPLTQQNNPYSHDKNSIVENGSPIGIYVCEKELRESWALRSAVSYDSVEQTLIRYLNSKGLRKDAAGVAKLSPKDVENVENLIANADYTQILGVKRALYPTFFSISLYNRTRYVQNSSLLQRFVLWKASWQVIEENWLLGVGIGDHKSAINESLDKLQIDLPRNMGAHNQFITFWLMGGILLPVALVLVFFVPFFYKEYSSNLLYFLFFLIVFLSCFTEDTLETQAGMTFYAFFNAFLLFCFNKNAIFTFANFDDNKQTIKL